MTSMHRLAAETNNCLLQLGRRGVRTYRFHWMGRGHNYLHLRLLLFALQSQMKRSALNYVSLSVCLSTLNSYSFVNSAVRGLYVLHVRLLTDWLSFCFIFFVYLVFVYLCTVLCIRVFLPIWRINEFIKQASYWMWGSGSFKISSHAHFFGGPFWHIN